METIWKRKWLRDFPICLMLMLILMKLWDQVLTPDLTLRYFFNVLRVYNTRILGNSPYLPGRHFALLITKTRSGGFTVQFCYSIVSLVTTEKDDILYSLSYGYSIILLLKTRKDILHLSLSYSVKSPVNTRRKRHFTCVVFSIIVLCRRCKHGRR